MAATDKQQRFVEEYCTCFNAAEAARRAGYSEQTARQQGQRLLTNVDIRAAIDVRLEELSMSAAEATKRLTDWGRGSVEPFLRMREDEENGAHVVIDLASDDAQASLHLLKKVKQTKTVTTGKDDYHREELRTEIELHDAKDAVIQIAKIRGLYIDRIDHTSGGKELPPIVVEIINKPQAGNGTGG